MPCDGCFKQRMPCTYSKRSAALAGLFFPHEHPDGLLQEQANDDDETGETVATAVVGGWQADPGPADPASNPSVLDIDALQLERRYANEETPPLVFLHKAWRRMARAQRQDGDGSPGRAGAEPQSVHTGDQPFDYSKPLRWPEKPCWLEQQQHFFNCWASTFHFIHRPTVAAWLETVYLNWVHERDLWESIGHARAAVAIMTMALGSRYRNRRLYKKKSQANEYIWTLNHADQLFSISLRLTDAEMGKPRLESVQARLLQDMYLITTCRMTLASYTFANTLQMIIALGLHRRRGRNRGLGRDIVSRPDYAKIQCERRTFWTANIIDKQLSIMYGRPSHFNDDTADQDLPDPVNDEDIGPNGPFRSHQSDCYIEALVSQAK